MTSTILIVEDEQKLAHLLRDYLQQSGYATHCIYDGNDVAPWLQHNTPALILLDLMLPNKDGLDICKETRQTSQLPIIMMTARVEEIDRLLGLELGADDYICKPYSPREVVARVKAVLRRTNAHSTSNTHKLSLQLNIDKMLTQLNEQTLDLTAVEFRLLQQLYQEPGRIFSREQLMDAIYDDHRIVSDRTIDSHIKKLRKKIAAVDSQNEWIHSVYGVGYKFEPPHAI